MHSLSVGEDTLPFSFLIYFILNLGFTHPAKPNRMPKKFLLRRTSDLRLQWSPLHTWGPPGRLCRVIDGGGESVMGWRDSAYNLSFLLLRVGPYPKNQSWNAHESEPSLLVGHTPYWQCNCTACTPPTPLPPPTLLSESESESPRRRRPGFPHCIFENDGKIFNFKIFKKDHH